MKVLINFITTYLIVLFIYELFLVVPAKKKKAGKKELVEIKYLVFKYGLDIKKVNYNQLLQIVALASSLDISLIVTIDLALNNWLLQILCSILLVLPIFIITYYFIFKFYKKKGMIKNV